MQKNYKQMFEVVLYIIAPTWKQFKYPSKEENQITVYPCNRVLLTNRKE